MCPFDEAKGDGDWFLNRTKLSSPTVRERIATLVPPITRSGRVLSRENVFPSDCYDRCLSHFAISGVRPELLSWRALKEKEAV